VTAGVTSLARGVRISGVVGLLKYGGRNGRERPVAVTHERHDIMLVLGVNAMLGRRRP